MQKEQPVIVKYIVYLLFLIVLYSIETANIPMEIMGFRIDLLPCVPAAVALMEGPVLGGFIGFMTGMLYDIGFIGVEGLFPIYYMLFGILAGAISMKFLRRMFPSMLLLSTCGMLVLGLVRYGLSLMLISKVPFPLVFQAMCGEILLTIVLSPIVYFPVRNISRRFEKII